MTFHSVSPIKTLKNATCSDLQFYIYVTINSTLDKAHRDETENVLTLLSFLFFLSVHKKENETCKIIGHESMHVEY